MDAVSYANSAKQAKRIKKFIENPDSESGIVTTPKVIQSGETITIPDGRMAVLPDLVIEGDLVLEGTGDVFIPAGSTLTGTVTLDTAQTIIGQKEFAQSPKVPNGVEPTDVVNKGQLDNSSISKVASSVLLSGNVAIDNSVITKSNANVTYTGKGTTQDIVTGIASVDFTVASNGSGYYHDRVAGDCIVKDDTGTIIESGSCVVNTSKVHIKGRSVGHSNIITDGLRGYYENIYTDSTSAEGGTGQRVTSFNIDGVSVGTDALTNQNTTTYILHQTLFTHIKWGLTSQGKRYISAYNPVTREVMTMYQGSGIAGHQIPNPLGIKLDYIENKSLDNAVNWWASDKEESLYALNLPDADYTTSKYSFYNDYIEMKTAESYNNGTGSYILYGFANSETKIITQYQGTGIAGNFVETKDVNGVAKKPRRWTIKSISDAGSWVVRDSERGNSNSIYLNLSTVETTSEGEVVSEINGLTINSTNGNQNIISRRYIAIVEFDTTASNDDTYFDLPTDNTNLSITNGKLAFTNGRSSNGGYKVETQDFTGSVDFSGISDGIKYIARDKLGNTFGYDNVSIGLYDKTSADDNRLVFDTESGKWYTTTGGELVINGTFDTDTSGWTASTNTIMSFDDGMISITNPSNINAYAYSSISGLQVGSTYQMSGFASADEQYGRLFISELIGTLISDYNIGASLSRTYDYTFVATAETMYINVGIGNINKTAKADNISVYKKEATLGTELPNPICFIDDKPYQVTSGTPMDRLVDYPSIPKNVMESTYVDGMLISTGNRKVIELGTIFNNNRYVIDNPFGNNKYMDCDVRVELYRDNKWGVTGYMSFDAYSNDNSYGTKALISNEGIIIQTGTIAVSGIGRRLGGVSNTQTTSAPARVIVTYVGEAK